jgi:HSP20 family protein
MADQPRKTGLTEAFWPGFVDPFRTIGAKIADFFQPSADAANAEDRYEINIELPGVKEDDVEITFNDHVLTVKGEKRAEHEEKGKTFYFSERSYGAFQRTFRLPEDIHADDIKATFTDGVLSLSVPKREPEKTKARTIKIDRG